ncbi:MAG TPA: c-type cytochrome [Gemmatimonadaceae bacterium]|nr:c-type cytochrome [Gemmatimonadaceae bacterium]
MRHSSLIIGAVVLAAAGASALSQGGGQGEQAPGRASAGGAARGSAAGVPLDSWQPRTLPPLPSGVTLAMIRQGDSVYHGKGGCVTCHDPEGMGMPNAGSAISLGLNFIPVTPQAIDSLVTAGIPEAVTRTAVAMPGRGASGNLTPDETKQVAAYVWAIAHVRDEPWPGGHRSHAPAAPAAASADTTGGRGQVTP